MTLLVGALAADGAVLIADRAAIFDGLEVAPGIPAIAEDRCKLVTGSGGVLAGLAGKESAVDVSGVTVSFLEALGPLLAATTTVSAAVAAIFDLFDENSSLFREHTGLGTVVPAPFTEPVLTVALVGGMTRQGPSLHAVGLCTTGPVQIHPLTSTAIFAPVEVTMDLEAAALSDAPTTVTETVELWGERLRNASAHAPSLLTADFDHAAVVDGVLESGYHQPPPSRYPRH